MTTEADLAAYLAHHAPELEPGGVSEWMSEHPKPGDEPGTHVEWAVRILRQLSESQVEHRPNVDRVADEIRRLGH